MRHYHIGQTVIPYEIDWSPNRETTTLSLDDSLELTIRAPMSATVSEIEEVLDSKQEWLLEKLYGLEEQVGPPYEKEFLSGEKLQYCGRQYRLKVVEGDVPEPRLSFDGQEFTMRVHRFDAPDDAVSIRRKRQTVVDWYLNQAQEQLPARSPRFESKLGVEDIRIDVRRVNGRWGEYDGETVRLNWQLVLAPVRIQDYVLAHELAHAVHEDHTDAFWNTVGTLIPDYKDRREWLRINGNTLTV